MAGKAITPDMLRAMIAEAVAEAVAAGTAPEHVTVKGGTLADSNRTAAKVKAASARKRSASTKVAPKAASARKPRSTKAAPKAWVVRESWKGETPSARMIGAALHYGLPLATVRKAQGCKFTLSSAIGAHRGLTVVVED